MKFVYAGLLIVIALPVYSMHHLPKIGHNNAKPNVCSLKRMFATQPKAIELALLKTAVKNNDTDTFKQLISVYKPLTPDQASSIKKLIIQQGKTEKRLDIILDGIVSFISLSAVGPTFLGTMALVKQYPLIGIPLSVPAVLLSVYFLGFGLVSGDHMIQSIAKTENETTNQFISIVDRLD